MTALLAVALVWSTACLAFVGGAWWGRALGRRQAAADLAPLLEDEACRAALHGHDDLAGPLFRLAAEVRELGAGEPAGATR